MTERDLFAEINRVRDQFRALRGDEPFPISAMASSLYYTEWLERRLAHAYLDLKNREALLARWNKAAAQDGPGTAGSEFHDDPENVFARVRQCSEAHHALRLRFHNNRRILAAVKAGLEEITRAAQS